MSGKIFLRHEKWWYVGKKFLTPKMVHWPKIFQVKKKFQKKISGKKKFFRSISNFWYFQVDLTKHPPEASPSGRPCLYVY
jgi:hypothetical protein